MAAALPRGRGHLRHRGHLRGRARTCWWPPATAARSSSASGTARTSWRPTRRPLLDTPGRWSTSTTARWRCSRADGYRVRTLTTRHVDKPVNQIEWDLATIERGGFPHFMLKEIFEQPESVRNTLRGHLLEEEGNVRGSAASTSSDDDCQEGQADHHHRLRHLVARGLVGEYMIEELARIPAEVEYASEFRYRNPMVDERHAGDRDHAVGRDGRHAGRAARGEAARRAAWASSTWSARPSRARRTAASTCTPAPRSAWPPPRRSLSQVAALALLTLRLGRLRTMSLLEGRRYHRGAAEAAGADRARCSTGRPKIEAPRRAVRRQRPTSCTWAAAYNFPVALEGALKLKEISYIHAEGYPAAEMKHGPIALIDENMPVVFVAPRDAVHAKIVSNIQEVRARGGKVIAIVNAGRRGDLAPGRSDLHRPGDARPAHARC